MSVYNELLLQLTEHPDEPALFAMTVDALIEEQGVDHISAHLAVSLHRDESLRARALAQATNLMRVGTPSGRYLVNLIDRVVGRIMPAQATIVVVVGYQRPSVSPPVGAETAARRRSRSVTVGAEWINARWSEREAELQRREAQFTRRTRRH
jgi:hypothetical protein